MNAIKPDPLSPRSQEIELKLSLPISDPSSLAKRLARTPQLARRKPTHWHLHNTYLQVSIGATCDVMQAGAIAVRLEADRGLVDFLRGVAAGQSRPR